MTHAPKEAIMSRLLSFLCILTIAALALPARGEAADAKQMEELSAGDVYVEVDTEIGGEPDASWFESVVRDILKAEDVAPPYEVSLVLTDEATVHSLNITYRNVDSPTDVIAFYAEPQSEVEKEFILPGDGVRRFGDVVISFPQAIEQAQEAGHSVERELTLLTIHGVLHLLGYDHADEEQKAIMWGHQALLLTRCLESPPPEQISNTK